MDKSKPGVEGEYVGETVSRRAGITARQEVAMGVKEWIRAKGLKPGDKLPSYGELIAELGFSLVTVKRGMDDLVAEGIIHRYNGLGSFVAKELLRMPRKLEHLGIIYPSSRGSLFGHPYLAEIMHGIEQNIPPHVDTHIFSLGEDGLVNAAQLAKREVSGVILLDMDNDDYLRAFAQWGTPGVVVDYSSQAAPLDYVACDNRGAAERVVAHLAALGHRRVAYVGTPSRQKVRRVADVQSTVLVRDSSELRERRDECLKALREKGMLVEFTGLTGEEPDGRVVPSWVPEELCRRIRSADGPTVVVAGSNYVARDLAVEVERLGVRVPEDLSICALASAQDTGLKGRELTCCKVDFFGMGRTAIELLVARCHEPVLDTPRVHRVGFEFIAGETVISAPV